MSLSIFVMCLNSCTHLKALVGLGLRKPEVHLSSVRLQHISFSKVELSIDLKVHNPNEFALNMERLEYQLSINETLVAKGKHQQPIMLTADQTANISLPAEVDLSNSLQIIKELLAGRKSQFIAKWLGTAYFHSSFGPIKIEHVDSKTLS